MNDDLYGDLVIVVSRDEVNRMDITAPLKVLREVLSTVESIRAHKLRLGIAFHGYNETSQELYEMPEVRDYVYALDAEFPYWLYFMTRHTTGLQCVMLCFFPPHLTEEAQMETHPKRLAQLLENRWGPALNHVAQSAGLSEEATDELLFSSLEYFKTGPSNL